MKALSKCMGSAGLFIGEEIHLVAHISIHQHYELQVQKGKHTVTPLSHPMGYLEVMEEEREAEKQGWLTQKQQQQHLGFQTITGQAFFMQSLSLLQPII